MKIGFAFVAALWGAGILAEATPDVPTMAAPIASLSAVGVLIALVWFLVTKQGPKERLAAQQHTEKVVDKICKTFAETVVATATTV